LLFAPSVRVSVTAPSSGLQVADDVGEAADRDGQEKECQRQRSNQPQQDAFGAGPAR